MEAVKEKSEKEVSTKPQLPLMNENVKKQITSVFSFAKMHCVNSDPENNQLLVGIVNLEGYLNTILTEYNKLAIEENSKKAIKPSEKV